MRPFLIEEGETEGEDEELVAALQGIEGGDAEEKEASGREKGAARAALGMGDGNRLEEEEGADGWA